MAYYEGETLKHRIERGPLTVDEALDIATQVSQALARAHESGIVHRDIKPANLMLPKDGPVKIVDLGLAKLVGHSELTKTGTTVGTVAYMAPEQIRGAEAGPAADVWGVGVVLYQMLSGRRPFEGKDDLATISKILDENPTPLGTVRPGLPDAVLRIVARALDKNVAHRYPSATELLADLKACRAALAPGQPVSAPISQLLRRPLAAWGIAAVLVAVSVPAGVAYRRASRTRWARNEGIPQIVQLVAKDDYIGAFELAKEVDAASPNDPALASLRPQFSTAGSIVTTPEGADVYVAPYGAGDAGTRFSTSKAKPRCGRRARMFERRQEIGRTLDLMEARTDIDTGRVAYLGASFGASVPLLILALEDRIKTAVLLAPGFSYRSVPPEADAVNYVGHITMPILMIGGRQATSVPWPAPDGAEIELALRETDSTVRNGLTVCEMRGST